MPSDPFKMSTVGNISRTFAFVICHGRPDTCITCSEFFVLLDDSTNVTVSRRGASGDFSKVKMMMNNNDLNDC